jgi:F0F1-type ATP synthase delta subunit
MKASRKIYLDPKKAVVTSAYQLSDEEMAAIKKSFSFLHLVEIVNVVDHRIMAGVVIQYKSRLIDLSLASQLNKLKEFFYETD